MLLLRQNDFLPVLQIKFNLFVQHIIQVCFVIESGVLETVIYLIIYKYLLTSFIISKNCQSSHEQMKMVTQRFARDGLFFKIHSCCFKMAAASSLLKEMWRFVYTTWLHDKHQCGVFDELCFKTCRRYVNLVTIAL